MKGLTENRSPQCCQLQNRCGPSRVHIPMQQHIGAPSKPLVKKGDTVKMGMKIGEPGGFVSSAVHSSVSGVVVDVQPCVLANGLQADCVIIDNDFKDEWVQRNPVKNPEALDAAALSALSREMGLVGLGGATFPYSVKLLPPKVKLDTPDRKRRGVRAIPVRRPSADAFQGQGNRRGHETDAGCLRH